MISHIKKNIYIIQRKKTQCQGLRKWTAGRSGTFHFRKAQLDFTLCKGFSNTVEKSEEVFGNGVIDLSPN
jgi:hypothetical protein